jgi:hypothetical protein
VGDAVGLRDEEEDVILSLDDVSLGSLLNEVGELNEGQLTEAVNEDMSAEEEDVLVLDDDGTMLGMSVEEERAGDESPVVEGVADAAEQDAVTVSAEDGRQDDNVDLAFEDDVLQEEDGIEKVKEPTLIQTVPGEVASLTFYCIKLFEFNLFVDSADMGDKDDMKENSMEGDMFGRPDLFGLEDVMIGGKGAKCGHCIGESGEIYGMKLILFLIFVDFALSSYLYPLFSGSSSLMSVDQLHHHLLFYHSQSKCPFEVSDVYAKFSFILIESLIFLNYIISAHSIFRAVILNILQ